MDESDYESDSPLCSGDFRSSTLTLKEKAALNVVSPLDWEEPELSPVPSFIKDEENRAELYPVAQTAVKGSALCCDVESGSQLVACGFREGRIEVFDLDTLSVHYKFEAPTDEAAACSAIRFISGPNLATKNVVLAAQGERVTQYHATSGTVMASMREEGNHVYALDVRNDGEVFVTGGSDHAVRVTDRNTRKVVSIFENSNIPGTQAHTNRIYSVSCSDENPQIVASGGWDKVVCIWDLRLGSCATTLFGPFVCGDSLSFYDNLLATGSWRNDNPVQIWDWRRPGLLRNLSFPQKINNSCLVYATKMLDGGYLGAGGSGSAPSFRVYNLEGRIMGSWSAPSAVHSIAAVTKGIYRRALVCCENHIATFSVACDDSTQTWADQPRQGSLA